MSKFLQACEMAADHPRKRRAHAARRQDSFTDHLATEPTRKLPAQFWLGLVGVDLTITAANIILVSGTAQRGIAGATITAGQALYLDSNNELQLCDADNTSTTATCVGISLHAALADQPLAYIADDNAVLGFGAILTVNTFYITSDTAGGIRPHVDIDSGDYLCLLGYAITTSNLRILVRNSGVTTA
jgi:hypothetical protein